MVRDELQEPELSCPDVAYRLGLPERLVYEVARNLPPDHPRRAAKIARNMPPRETGEGKP